MIKFLLGQNNLLVALARAQFTQSSFSVYGEVTFEIVRLSFQIVSFSLFAILIIIWNGDSVASFLTW